MYAHDLQIFTTQALSKAGLSKSHAKIVAETLVEADLLGHRTHFTIKFST